MTASARGQKGRSRQDSGSDGRKGPVVVDLVVSPGCFASAIAVTQDVLSTANVLSRELGGPSPLFESRVFSVDGQPVRATNGTEVAVVGSVEDGSGDLVMLFGPGMADSGRILRDITEPWVAPLGEALRRAMDRGATLCASCSSTFLLAESGLLDGRPATTSWWLAPTFRERYPEVELQEDDLVVEAGRVVTAGAALAQIDLALQLVRDFAGAELAAACARYLVVDGDRRAQGPFVVIEHLARNDELVERAERMLRDDLANPPSVAALAKALATTPRTLTRRFVAATGLPPSRFLRRLRLETAATRLRATDDSIERIAAAVGYEDERAFRRAFASELGTSPARFRRGR